MMNSPFANIFLSIQERIKTNAPSIKHIDQDLGQLKNTRPPLSWPCVLIDFEDFNFEDLSENVQLTNGTVVLRLGFAPHSNTSAATPAPFAEQALNYYDIEWQLHQLMHGWRPLKNVGTLCRTSATTQKRNDAYRIREIRYSIAFEDYSTKRTLSYAPATLIVDEQVQLPASS